MAKRLARLALARDYGKDLVHRSPRFLSMKRAEGRIGLLFKDVGSRLVIFDHRDVLGFTVAGEDRVFRKARARLTGENSIEVWSDEVADPVAVRYAWADNPVCNIYSREGLPLTPFRTDDWPGITRDSH